MLKALLVDDELNGLENLAFLLAHDCHGIEVVGKASNAADARIFLEHHQPDVIFWISICRAKMDFNF